MNTKKPTSLSDAELLCTINEGNHELFSILYERYKKRTYVQAYKFFHNTEQAEDVVQDIFLKMFTLITEGKLRSSDAFSTLLFCIVKNHCIDVFKKNQKHYALGSKKIEQEYSEVIAPCNIVYTTPEDITIHKENLLLLQDCITKLSEKDRTVISLYFSDKYSYNEIVSTLDLTLDVTKARIHRAKQSIKKMILAKHNFIAA